MHLPFFLKRPLAATDLEPVGSNPDKTWTRRLVLDVQQKWGELRKARRKGEDSVIGRLAQSYSDLLQLSVAAGRTLEQARLEIIDKVTIKLISNQAIQSKLFSIIGDAQNILELEYPSVSCSFQELLIKLPATHRVPLQKLAEVSGLGDDFTDFIRIFDTSGCGEVSRLRQRSELLRTLGESVSNSPIEGLRRVCDLVRDEAQPERVNSRGILQEDVLAALNVTTYDSLFPSVPRFESIVDLIDVSGPQLEITEKLLNSPTRRMIVHGSAGTGKTTTIRGLQRHLPADSVVIAYDCYGGGSYQDLHAERHSVPRAVTQLSNELAVRCGVPFLIEAAKSPADALRSLNHRLRVAANAVRDVNKRAVLLILIDAADNAVAASRLLSGDCFVQPLWSLWDDLPTNCYLLMTSRSHRQTELISPPNTARYELLGFTEEASAEHLRKLFPGATERSCSAFHSRTAYNPRVQSYLLDNARRCDPLPGWFQVMRRVQLTPFAIFQDLISSAMQGASEKTRQHLCDLACLIRPVPVQSFAYVCEISLEEAVRLCYALAPGVQLRDSEIVFRDEDFENHLRTLIADVNKTHQRLGMRFLQIASDDRYAAEVVAEHLYASSMADELINLALNGPGASVIKDDLQRMKVLRRRLELALRASSDAGRDKVGVLLLLKAAELAKTNTAVIQLVRANAALAARFGDPLQVAELCAREANAEWFGPAHVRMAAIYSRSNRSAVQARQHLNHAQAWLRRYFRERDTNHWQFSNTDLAAWAEAAFFLDGAEGVYALLRTWRPGDFALGALHILIDRLCSLVPPYLLELHSKGLRLPLSAECIILSGLWQAGHLPSQERIKTLLRRVKIAYSRGTLPRICEDYYDAYPRRNEPKDWLLAVCEIAASARTDTYLILRLLEENGPKLLDQVPHAMLDFGRYLPPIKALCLRSVLLGKVLAVEDLLPARYRLEEVAAGRYDHHADKRRIFYNTIGIVFPMLYLRAQAIRASITADSAEATVSNFVTSMQNRYKELSYANGGGLSIFGEVACDALIRCSGAIDHLVAMVADVLGELPNDSVPNIWLQMAKVLLYREDCRDVAFKLIERAARYVTLRSMPGKERWEVLLVCSELTASSDEFQSRLFYEQALKAAGGIDDDVTHTFSFAAKTGLVLADRKDSKEQGPGKRQVASRLCGTVELYRPYVSNPDQLPFESILEASCKLDPLVGLATSVRWDALRYLELDDCVVPLIRGLISSCQWETGLAMSLIFLSGNESDISLLAVESLNNLHSLGPSQRVKLPRLLDFLCRRVGLDTPLPLREEAMRRILAWAELHGFGNRPSVVELRRGWIFAASLKRQDCRLGSEAAREERKIRLRKWTDASRTGRLDDFAKDRLDLRLLPEKELLACLTELGRKVEKRRRVEFLNFVTSISVSIRTRHPVVEALEQLLREWRLDQHVIAWVQEGISDWVTADFRSLMGYQDQVANLQAVCKLASPQVTAAKALLSCAVHNLAILSPSDFTHLASALAISLDPKELEEVLKVILNELELRLESEEEETLQRPTLVFDQALLEGRVAFATFCWQLMGHPDKRVRWQAIHSARQAILADRPDSQLLESFIGFLERTEATAFQYDPEFFSMSASVHLLLLLERLSDEFTIALVPFVANIARHALSREFPHAQIRGLARKICLRILRDFPELLPTDTISRIEAANQPVASLYPRTRLPERPSRFEMAAKRKGRFNFCTVDTLPYWFEPLSGVFGHCGPEVVEVATNWVCDVWGRTNQDCRVDAETRRRRYDYRLTANRHGSFPTVENLKLYLEYHAMMCAAGTLVDSKPVSVGPKEDYPKEDPWYDWLRDKLPALPHCWEADLRGPSPLRKEYWGVLPPSRAEKRFDDFHRSLGVGEPDREGWLVIYSYTTFGARGRTDHEHVKSAFVGTKTARALLSAMQTTVSNILTLPIFQIDSSRATSFGDGDYQVIPFLFMESDRDRGLEEKDGAARGMPTSFVFLSKDFEQELDLELCPTRCNYVSKGGELIGEVNIWSDDVHHQEQVEREYSYGHRISVKIDALQKYLQARDFALIIEVEIQRNEDGSYVRGDGYDHGRRVVYLLRPDGGIETLAGNCTFGTADSEGVGI